MNSRVFWGAAWAELPIANRDDPALPAIGAFAREVGRGLLIYPIYRGLMAQGDWGRPHAAAFFARARPGYHQSIAAGVEKIVMAGKSLHSADARADRRYVPHSQASAADH